MVLALPSAMTARIPKRAQDTLGAGSELDKEVGILRLTVWPVLRAEYSMAPCGNKFLIRRLGHLVQHIRDDCHGNKTCGIACRTGLTYSLTSKPYVTSFGGFVDILPANYVPPRVSSRIPAPQKQSSRGKARLCRAGICFSLLDHPTSEHANRASFGPFS